MHLDSSTTENQKFNIVFGAPVILGIDWNIYQNLYFSGKYFITNEIETHLSYFINDITRISVSYASNLNRSSKSYFPSEILSINNDNYTFNNVKHFNNTISLQAGIKLHKNISMNIASGYKLKSNIKLIKDDEEIYTLTSKDNAFIKIGFNYLIYR